MLKPEEVRVEQQQGGVRVEHIATGLFVFCDTYYRQHENRDEALRRLSLATEALDNAAAMQWGGHNG